jgi:hypothetical protein
MLVVVVMMMMMMMMMMMICPVGRSPCGCFACVRQGKPTVKVELVKDLEYLLTALIRKVIYVTPRHFGDTGSSPDVSMPITISPLSSCCQVRAGSRTADDDPEIRSSKAHLVTVWLNSACIPGAHGNIRPVVRCNGFRCRVWPSRTQV